MEQYLSYIILLPYLFMFLSSLVLKDKSTLAQAIPSILSTFICLIFFTALMNKTYTMGPMSYVFFDFNSGGIYAIKIQILLDSISITLAWLGMLMAFLSLILNYMEDNESFNIRGYSTKILFGSWGLLLSLLAGNTFTFLIGMEAIVISLYGVDRGLGKKGEDQGLKPFFAFQIGLVLVWMGSIILDGERAGDFLSVASGKREMSTFATCLIFGGLIWLTFSQLLLPLKKRTERLFLPINLLYSCFAIPASILMLYLRFYSQIAAFQNILFILSLVALSFSALFFLNQKDTRNIIITLGQFFFSLSLCALFSLRPGSAFFLFGLTSLSVICLGFLLTIFVENFEKNYCISRLENLQEKSPLLFWMMAILVASLIGFPGTSGSFAIIEALSVIMTYSLAAGVWSTLCLCLMALGLIKFFLIIGLLRKSEYSFDKDCGPRVEVLCVVVPVVLISLLVGYWGLPEFGDNSYSLIIQTKLLESIPLNIRNELSTSFQGIFFTILPLLLIGITFLAFNLFIKNRESKILENWYYKFFTFLNLVKNKFYIFQIVSVAFRKQVFYSSTICHKYLERCISDFNRIFLEGGIVELGKGLAQLYGRNIVSGIFIALLFVTLALFFVLQVITT